MAFKYLTLLVTIIVSAFLLLPLQASAQTVPLGDAEELGAKNLHNNKKRSRKTKLTKINYDNGIKHLENGNFNKAEQSFKKATYSEAFRLHAYYKLAVIN
jgi:TolA-binding protein